VASLGAVALGAGAPASAGVGGLPVQIGVDDQLFSPKSPKVGLPIEDVLWTWDADGSGAGTTDTAHNVVSFDRLFQSPLQSSGTYELTVSAGTFRYYCVLHREMSGKLRVAPYAAVAAAHASPGAKVIFASREAETGDRYDVRAKAGKGKWRFLKEDTRRRSLKIKPKQLRAKSKRRRPVTVQVRSQKGKGEQKRSDWSPKLKL
jgi:plastocyanin